MSDGLSEIAEGESAVAMRIVPTEAEIVSLRQEIERRELVIREYQRRARAAVRVLQKHGLAYEYLDEYEALGG